jgi:HSP20 family molecular chaperone IbpA
MEQKGWSAPEGEDDAIMHLLQAATDRTAAIAATLKEATEADPPVALHSTSDRFQMTLNEPGLRAADVSTHIVADQLLVKIRRTQESREDDEQFRQTRSWSSTWERSFRLEFTPTPSKVNVTVTPDGVTVTASRAA